MVNISTQVVGKRDSAQLTKSQEKPSSRTQSKIDLDQFTKQNQQIGGGIADIVRNAKKPDPISPQAIRTLYLAIPEIFGVNLSEEQIESWSQDISKRMKEKGIKTPPDMMTIMHLKHRLAVDAKDHKTALKQAFDVALSFTDKQRQDKELVHKSFAVFNHERLLGDEFNQPPAKKAKIISDLISNFPEGLGIQDIANIIRRHKDDPQCCDQDQEFLDKAKDVGHLFKSIGIPNMDSNSYEKLFENKEVQDILSQENMPPCLKGNKIKALIETQFDNPRTLVLLKHIYKNKGVFANTDPIKLSKSLNDFLHNIDLELIGPDYEKLVDIFAKSYASSGDKNGQTMAALSNNFNDSLKEEEEDGSSFSTDLFNLQKKNKNDFSASIQESEFLQNLSSDEERINFIEQIKDWNLIDNDEVKFKAFQQISELKAFKDITDPQERFEAVTNFIQAQIEIDECKSGQKRSEQKIENFTRNLKVFAEQNHLNTEKEIKDGLEQLKSKLGVGDQKGQYSTEKALSTFNDFEGMNLIRKQDSFDKKIAVINDILEVYDINPKKGLAGFYENRLLRSKAKSTINQLSLNPNIQEATNTTKELIQKIKDKVDEYKDIRADATSLINANISPEEAKEYISKVNKELNDKDLSFVLIHGVDPEFVNQHESTKAVDIVNDFNTKKIKEILEKELAPDADIEAALKDMKERLGYQSFTDARAEDYADTYLQLKQIENDPEHQFDKKIAVVMLPEYKDDMAFRPSKVVIQNLKEQGYTVFLAERDDQSETLELLDQICKNKNGDIVRPLSALVSSGHGSGVAIDLTEDTSPLSNYRTDDSSYLDTSDDAEVNETLKYFDPNGATWALLACLSCRESSENSQSLGDFIAERAPSSLTVQGPMVSTPVHGAVAEDERGLPIISLDELRIIQGHKN